MGKDIFVLLQRDYDQLKPYQFLNSFAFFREMVSFPPSCMFSKTNAGAPDWMV